MANNTTSTTDTTATGAPAAGTVAGDSMIGDTAVMGTSASELGGTAGSDPAGVATAKSDELRDKASAVVDRVKVEATKGKEQALAAASTYADQGKGKAAGALTTLSGLIVEAAKMLEENFGHRAADPVRAQADKVSGAARHLETADVDQLTAELKAFAKNNPILSVGAVAVVGFALGKLLSGGGHHD